MPIERKRHEMKKAKGFGEVNRYVAGIDLAGAADHYVCGPRKDDGTHDIEHFGTTTSELSRMLAWLLDRGVTSAAMESTSVFWIPVYDMLECGGIKPVLVDTRQVHMIPGKKSDVQDCQWRRRREQTVRNMIRKISKLGIKAEELGFLQQAG